MNYPNYFSVDRVNGSSETNRAYESGNYSFSQNSKVDFSHYSVSIGDALCSGNVRHNKIAHQKFNPFGSYYGNYDLHNQGRGLTQFHNRGHQGFFGFGVGRQIHNPEVRHDCGCGDQVSKPKPQPTKPNCGYDKPNTQPTKPDCGCPSTGGTSGTQWGQTKKADIYSPIDLKAWFSDGRKSEIAPSVFGEYSFDS